MNHGYNTFPEDVRKANHDIIQRYGFETVSESSNELILKSKHCIVAFVAEYDYVQFCFKERGSDRWMFLGPFIEACHPERTVEMPMFPEDTPQIEKIRSYLRFQAEIIREYCHPIFNGDFSWVTKYED